MKICLDQLLLSLQRNVHFFLLIPVDHPADIYDGSAEKA